MWSFLKYVMATWVAMFLFFITFLLFLVVLASGDEGNVVSLEENSILKLSFDKKIVERDEDNPFADSDLPFVSNESSIGLDVIKKALEHAAKDPKIKGIYLDVSSMRSGLASSQAIRDALVKFKKSKKFIIGFNENMSEGAYFLHSVADKIYLHPMGEFEFNGLASEGYFLKGALEKLEIKTEIFKVGEYKSAVEMFTSDRMSPADKEQTTSFLNSIYGHMLSQIAPSRKIELNRLRVISDSMLVHNAQDAVRLGLIDGLKYYDEIETELKKRTGLGAEKKPRLVSLRRYLSTIPETSESTETSENKIAVIYAEGDIVLGNGDDDSMGADRISGLIRKARNDEKIKAIVLRINSPGGSALASDIMWREVWLTAQKKTIIASMSDVAASGGYYLAMACDSIVAEPVSITGSIGVFGVLLNVKNFLKNKLGVTTDRVTTGYFSDIPNPSRDLTPYERKSIQEEVENIYQVFTQKAADGRRMSVEELKKVASGRVWSGLEAKENGLIDALGGLDRAIQMAAKTAKLGKDYTLINYPEDKKFIDRIMTSLAGDGEAHLRHVYGEEMAFYLNQWKKWQLLDKYQARLPYEMVIR